MCSTKDIGELFLDKPDELVLAFDRVMTTVMEWQPNDVGSSIHSIVFTNHKAWLIIKPMKKQLDVKFYDHEEVFHDLIVKRTSYGNKYAHHIRVSSQEEITRDLIELLRIGYDYALQ